MPGAAPGDVLGTVPGTAAGVVRAKDTAFAVLCFHKSGAFRFSGVFPAAGGL